MHVRSLNFQETIKFSKHLSIFSKNNYENLRSTNKFVLANFMVAYYNVEFIN